jgi:arginine decarboxylase
LLIKTPTKYFLSAGSSEGYSLLNAFDNALLNGGVGNTNIVKMSSILPPHCQPVEPIKLPLGALVPMAYSSLFSDVSGELISAAVAIAIPEDDDFIGLIMEFSAPSSKDIVESIVREMALKGMETRKKAVKEIKSISIEHKVQNKGAVFAGVVLWD